MRYFEIRIEPQVVPTVYSLPVVYGIYCKDGLARNVTYVARISIIGIAVSAGMFSPLHNQPFILRRIKKANHYLQTFHIFLFCTK